MENRKCRECGKEFKPHSSNQYYCCPACGRRYNNRKAKLMYHKRKNIDVSTYEIPEGAEPVPCPMCGKMFVQINYRGVWDYRVKYCSDKCRNKAIYQSRKTSYKTYRRAKKKEKSKQIVKKVMTIAEVNAAAKLLGMDYGTYVATHNV